ncbi:hypothetical protein [Shimia marina]|uniref:Uncharacterized protein n=1 Tax=Shimia marina TaxID=321267 RepID=A0A0P1FFP3_9RHOB|nr:hypothetical protein [Shimia marina]CUH52191.1 hypothetical protein SHM7688_01633 [Shimia marina]SFE71930.1 hypothetical protein SAMN04488037_1175 [Shimia marina]
MLLERTLNTLQTRTESPRRAEELGTLGYLQWLAGLPRNVGYPKEAERALEMAEAFEDTDPAVQAFCALLRESLQNPLQVLSLDMPERRRRGGAKARRRMV